MNPVDKIVLNPSAMPHHSDIYFGFDFHLCHSIAKRGVILIDAAIAHTHGPALQKSLGYELIEVPSGEEHKTRETKQKLEDELFKRKIGRDSLLVAVGGGVTTDLVGFLASTYMRGVPLVLIPTTLLAMVDAAIGGKTGVDTPFGKNLVGSFYLPKAIFIDTELLKTLPEKEMRNGYSEILKYGLIEDSQIWQRWRDLSFSIRASIACKVKVVSEDFEETKGLRRILNFGHTVGHALEMLSHFQMPHGEAVALGCMAEGYLSHLLGHLSKQDLETILELYRSLNYRFKKVDPRAFLDAMALDKKAKGGHTRFVLLEKIGACVSFGGEYCTAVKQDALDEMVRWMNHENS